MHFAKARPTSDGSTTQWNPIIDIEEVYSMSMGYQLTAATVINFQAWTTIFGAISSSRDSGGEEGEHSEGNNSIVH